MPGATRSARLACAAGNCSGAGAIVRGSVCRIVGAVALFWPGAASAQVFQSQGPGPRFSPVELASSADSAPNGHDAGAIQAILLNPALGANTIFAGSVNGGVWVTQNGGTTWT